MHFLQRNPTQWIILAAVILAIILVVMPSSETNLDRSAHSRPRHVSHNPNHGHHEHDDAHDHEAAAAKPEEARQEAQRKAMQNEAHKHDAHAHGGAHAHDHGDHDDVAADDRKEKPGDAYIPNLKPHHVDHGHADPDILFTMPRPAVRGDLLPVVIDPKQGFFGGEKIPSTDHFNPRTVMWQAPAGKPTGVLLLFHGCNHDGSDWFNGPAERRIVAHALSQGLVCVALQAGTRHGSKCWFNDWPIVINNDIIMTRSTLSHFFQHPKRAPWLELPQFALGASSGGTFVSILSRVWLFDAIAMAVSPGLKDAFLYNPALRRLPATAFLYMKGDTTWASKLAIDTQVEKLRERRLESQAFEQSAKQITMAFLTAYLDMPQEKIHAVHEAMQKLGMIDHSGNLLGDPRKMKVGELVVAEVKKADPEFDAAYWQAGIQQMANIAEGVHEISFEEWPEALAWMREHGTNAA